MNSGRMSMILVILSLQLLGLVTSTDDEMSRVNLKEGQGDIKSNSQQRRGQVLDNPECRDEIPSRCEGNRTPLTDLEALNCILNQKRDEMKEIKPSCNHALWVFRNSIMDDSGFLSALDKKCQDEIRDSGCGNSVGDTLTCAIDHKEKLQSDDCREEISLVERVMFSDYAVIGKFAEICKSDIMTHNCGRGSVDAPLNPVTEDGKFLPTSQGLTIECLSGVISNISQACAIEILRVAELQADDYHLDRALYFSCREDRETFCKEVAAGNGKVYRCLLENKMQTRMSEPCRTQLLRRQKLTAQDFKVSSLPFACKAEIKKFKCRKGTDTDKHVRLSQILLCLESAGHGGQGLNGECVEEMRLHRKSLMEDHQATPELLADCAGDTKKFCPSGKPVEGATIHCLMAHAMSPRKAERISPNCRARLEELLKIADIGENWNVDPVLKEKCHQVVLDSSCRDVPSKDVMTCLMRLLTTNTLSESDGRAMNEDCEDTLLQIQYFMTRDFRLNQGLYDECKIDAENVCGIKQNWNLEEEGQKSPSGQLILSCLYRNLVDENGKVSRGCGEKVREAMRERALSVSLNPELEESCLEDLSDLCSEKTRPGEELKCLQTNVEVVSKPCKESLLKFTHMELIDPSIDPLLWKYCGDVIGKCSSGKKSQEEGDKGLIQRKSKTKEGKEDEDDESGEGDGDDLMDCLIKSKHEMKNKKCKGRVEYLQLLQLAHIDFSPKFKALCQADVIRRCGGIPQITASKLVSCLSGHIWNDTLYDQPHRISKPCRKQVKMLTLSNLQLEDNKLGDGMYAICREAVERLCKGVTPGGGRILECLRTKQKEINEPKCLSALFPLEQSVDQDGGLDLFLLDQCSFEIKTFCPPKVLQEGKGGGSLLTCLKLNTNQEGFDGSRCGKAVRRRLVEQNSDLRLNPALRKACGTDIRKVCPNVALGEGRILDCLKAEFVRGKNGLSIPCKSHVEGFLRGGAGTDVRLDYTLNKLCEGDIERSCRSRVGAGDEAGGDGGVIEECLKELFHRNKLVSVDCKAQVRLIIQSTQIDIHVDPILHRACSIDLLKRCDGVLPGEGRLVACLLAELDREHEGGSSRLSPDCSRLLAGRAELFQVAGKGMGMESMSDLYVHVAESSSRNYFLIVGMTILGLIFVIGLFCGRVTKRRAAAKDK